MRAIEITATVLILMMIPLVAAAEVPDVVPANGTQHAFGEMEFDETVGRALLTYYSDGLRVRAWVYRDASSEPAPLVIFNHGGVSGVPEKTDLRCRELAAGGYIVIAPFFRGEDGSEGEVEVALGEVDDVLAALDWAEANLAEEMISDRVAMIGTSHGALVSLLAASRDERVRAVVSAYGVTDIELWYRYLLSADLLGDDELTKKAYGGGPDMHPHLFKSRSAVEHAEQIDCPVLLIQGAQDTIVPPSQAYVMFRRLKALNKTVEYDGPYPNSSHGLLFKWEEDKYAPEEVAECAAAWDRVTEFLERHLQVESRDGTA